MDFIDQLRQFSKRVESMKDSIQTEEATKTAIIMPFFAMLGYDVFNPQEFVPEFTADVGIKKGEKVDYAIIKEEQPVILVECKSISENTGGTDRLPYTGNAIFKIPYFDTKCKKHLQKGLYSGASSAILALSVSGQLHDAAQYPCFRESRAQEPLDSFCLAAWLEKFRLYSLRPLW